MPILVTLFSIVGTSFAGGGWVKLPSKEIINNRLHKLNFFQEKAMDRAIEGIADQKKPVADVMIIVELLLGYYIQGTPSESLDIESARHSLVKVFLEDDVTALNQSFSYLALAGKQDINK